MSKPPVSSKLTHFESDPPPPSWEWDSVRHVRIGDTDVIRHTLVIQREHFNILTPSMGSIQPYDFGRELVVDVYRDGRVIDIIQDVKRFASLESTRTESISATIAAMIKLQQDVHAAIKKLERVSSSEAKTVRVPL